MRLTGVGVGPGDPDLVTVKALKVFAAASVVFTPVGSPPTGSLALARPLDDAGATGYAERVVRAHIDAAKVRRVVFALSDDPAARERSWDAAGRLVVDTVRAMGHVAFATIGDPNLYSTFTYLADTVRALEPQVAIATVPGITALQDLAARNSTVLAEGTQTLALLPMTAGEHRITAALAAHDTVVAYKGGRHLHRLRALLADAGRLDDAVFGARLGLNGEVVGPLPETGDAPYLSTVIVTRPRGERGALLGERERQRAGGRGSP